MEKTKKEKKPLMTKNEKEFVCTLFALIIIAIFFIATPPSGLSTDGMKVLGVFISVLFLWITVGIGWPSLLCLAALAFVPSLGMKTTLQNSFGNETFAFLLFTFMFTYAFSQTGYVKKIALGFVTSKFARKSPWRFAFCFFAAVLIIGLFMSPTVLYFIILPILEEIYNVLGLKKGDKYANMLMMGLVFCTSLSSGMTPIAHVFPVLSMGVFKSLTGSSISYGQYMLYAIPTGIIIFALMMLVFKFLMRPNTKKINLKSSQFDKMKKEIPSATQGEKIILGTFLLVVALWVLPSLLKTSSVKWISTAFTWISSLGTAMPPLFGIIVLSILKYQGKPLININESMVKGVSWPSIIMASATLALGAAMTNKAIGLTTFLSASIAPITTGLSPVLLILLFSLWAGLQSNVSSHMVTAQLVPTLAVPVALASGGALNAAAITAIIGLIASTGSAAPPAMPYVAVAGSSGWSDSTSLLKYGFLMMFIIILVATFVGYPLANLIMPM